MALQMKAVLLLVRGIKCNISVFCHRRKEILRCWWRSSEARLYMRKSLTTPGILALLMRPCGPQRNQKMYLWGVGNESPRAARRPRERRKKQAFMKWMVLPFIGRTPRAMAYGEAGRWHYWLTSAGMKTGVVAWARGKLGRAALYISK